jgi:hypothetical protein
MIYFDSDMSKSTNTVVYYDWKTVIYIYVCGKCRTQFMLPIEKSVTFTGGGRGAGLLLTLHHFCVCAKPRPEFSTSYVMVSFDVL